MQDYGEATIRARIKLVIESIPNSGQVHDYERWMSDWNELVKLFVTQVNGQDLLLGWSITLENVSNRVVGFQGAGTDGTVGVTYTYRVRGFMGLSDADQSEKAFTSLVLQIAHALEDDPVLNSKIFDSAEPIVAEVRIEPKMFAGVLCHSAELRLTPQEVL
jgi:hypothetical protein